MAKYYIELDENNVIEKTMWVDGEYTPGPEWIEVQSDATGWNGLEWDPIGGALVDPDALLAAQVRSERDNILERVVDPIVTNPLRWVDLSEDKQAEWTQYRRDLLDITEQEGFPNEVTWPTKPGGS